MNARISFVRKNAKLNQQEFAAKIGLTKNFISLLETGDRKPSDRTISDICREFGCSEHWLRTGDGEPFQEESRQEQIMRFAAQIVSGSDEFKKAFVAMLAQMDEKDWTTLAKIFETVSNNAKK